MDGLQGTAEPVPADALVESEPTGGERGDFVRDRAHRFPGRRHALKVLYDDVEVASVRAARRPDPHRVRRGGRPVLVRLRSRPCDVGGPGAAGRAAAGPDVAAPVRGET